MTDTQDIKDVARAFYESYGQRDLDTSFDNYVAADAVTHAGGDFDRAGWLAFEKTLVAGFADLELTVLDQVAEGDKVTTRYYGGGTHTAEFAGIPASGNSAFATGIAIDRVVDGKIVERWAVLDFGAFLQQLSTPDPA